MDTGTWSWLRVHPQPEERFSSQVLTGTDKELNHRVEQRFLLETNSSQGALNGTPEKVLGGTPEKVLGGTSEKVLGGTSEKVLGGTPGKVLGGTIIMW